MIIGQYTSNLGKGRRVAVPGSFRKVLGKEFIISRWYEKCLVLVTKSSWQELLKRVTGEGRLLTTPVRDTDRFIMGSAYLVNTDAQGRIIVPQNLADYAKISGEITFLGLGDRVELWDSEEWRKREQFVSTHADLFLESIAKDK